MRAHDQALFCLVANQSVETYRSLTRVERDAFWNLTRKT